MENIQKQKSIEKITTSKGLVVQLGNTYTIDNEFVIKGNVHLIKIYGDHVCRVQDPDTGTQWDTMLNRLSKP